MISLVISLALRHRDAVRLIMKIIVMSAVVTFKMSSMQIIAWMFSGAVRALGRRLDAVSA